MGVIETGLPARLSAGGSRLPARGRPVPSD